MPSAVWQPTSVDNEAEWEFDEVTRAMSTPRFRRDPYPFYEQMRREHPLYRSSKGAWYLTNYADVRVALLHPRLSSQGESKFRWSAQFTPAVSRMEKRLRRSVVHTDRPDHTRLRKLVNKALTARRVQAHQPRIEALAIELLDRAVAKGSSFDLISEFAYPLTITVVCELLGILLKDHEPIRRWSRTLLDNASFIPSPKAVTAIEQPMKEFEDYLQDLIARRRSQSGDDLVSALIEAKEHGDRLNEDELLSMCFLLLAGGHETIRNLIGNGMLALLRHSEQLRRLREKPTLIGQAIEELLRYDNPTQMRLRIATGEIQLGGYSMSEGDAVVMMLGAANRDPKRFPDPDRLDITRPNNRSLSFGNGIHFCLGAPLARLEAEVAIRILVERLPGLRLETEALEWRPNPHMRGLLALPVAF